MTSHWVPEAEAARQRVQMAIERAAEAARNGDLDTARRELEHAQWDSDLAWRLNQEAQTAAQEARAQERRVFEQQKDSPEWREADARARALEEQAQRTLEISHDVNQTLRRIHRELSEMERKRGRTAAKAAGLGALAIGLGLAGFFIFFPPGGGGVAPAVAPLPNALPGVGALSWGDTHLVTFDGLQLDFQAAGEFVLVRSDAGDLEVQVRQQPAPDSETVSLNTAAAANVAGDRVSLDTEQEPSLHVNGEPTTVPADGITLPNGGQVSFDGRSAYTLTWSDGSIVVLQTLGSNNRWMDANIHLSDSRAGSVTGLLGNADGDAENDLAREDGTVVSVEDLNYEDLYDDFGDSWRIGEADSLFDYEPGESTETFADLEFPAEVVTVESLSDEERQDATGVCRDAGVTEEPFLSTCVLDVALTGDSSFAEATAALQEAVSGAPTPTGFGEMHLEVSGDIEDTIDFSFDREASSYFPPDGLMTLIWTNDANRRVVIGTTVFTGTRTHVTVQMNLVGGPGFSHNAFANQCRMTVTTQEDATVAGRLFCSFTDITVSGFFEATF
jgi:von Willebrand factor type D domain